MTRVYFHSGQVIFLQGSLIDYDSQLQMTIADYTCNSGTIVFKLEVNYITSITITDTNNYTSKIPIPIINSISK